MNTDYGFNPTRAERRALGGWRRSVFESAHIWLVGAFVPVIVALVWFAFYLYREWRIWSR